MPSTRVVGLANACLVLLLSACGGAGVAPEGISSSNASSSENVKSPAGVSSSPMGISSSSVVSASSSSYVTQSSSLASSSDVSSSSVSSEFSSSAAVSSSVSSSSSSDSIVFLQPGAEAPVAEGPEGYVFCANEAVWGTSPNVCEFKGTRIVAYGANGQFNYKVATGSVVCDNATLGSPVSFIRKSCFVSLEPASAVSSSAESSTPSSASSSVESSIATSSSVASSSLASSSVSSAPIVIVQPGAEAPVTEGPADFVFCTNEAEWINRATPNVCNFNGTRTVAYGADGQFSYTVATGSIVCSNESFTDPVKGFRKACFVSVAPADANSSSSSSASSSGSGLGDAAFVCAAPKPTAVSPAFKAASCAGCHGADGSGGVGPSLQDATFASFAEFEQIVRAGQGFMPPVAEAAYPREAMLNDFAYFTHQELCNVDQQSVTSSCEVRGELFEPQLRRLTQTQLVNSIVAVFGDIFDNRIWPDLGDSIPTIGMSNNASTLQVDSVNLERIHATVSAVISRLQTTTVSSCVGGTGTTCIDNLIVQYAPQLWRRPLTDQELSDLTGALLTVRGDGASRAQQVEFVFRSLLMSPNFLFRMELGSLQDAAVHLDSYEIASLLSYALWDSPPDAILYDLADADQLTNQSVIDQQVERMMQDKRFQGALIGFFADYLKIERVLSAEKLSELNFTEAQRRDLLESALRMIGSKVVDIDQDLMSVFSGNEFYINNTIAPLFGLNASNFGSEFVLTSINSEERSGILTHPAFLAVHSTAGTSGIVKRGVFALEQLLCVHLGDPPTALTEAPLPPDVDPATTSTRVLLQLTHSTQPACISCHQAIDPAGFGFESYDVLGRFQAVEKGSVPIDASGELSNVIDEPLVFADHIEYVQGLVQTPEMRACVSRRMLESFSGQYAKPNACELDKLSQKINQNGTSIRGLIKSLTQLESVRLRSQ